MGPGKQRCVKQWLMIIKHVDFSVGVYWDDISVLGWNLSWWLNSAGYMGGGLGEEKRWLLIVLPSSACFKLINCNTGQHLALKIAYFTMRYTPFDIVWDMWAAVVLQERMWKIERPGLWCTHSNSCVTKNCDSRNNERWVCCIHWTRFHSL